MNIPKEGWALDQLLGDNLGISCLVRVSLYIWGLGRCQVVHADNVIYGKSACAHLGPWGVLYLSDPFGGDQAVKVSHMGVPCLSKNLGHQGLSEGPWLTVHQGCCHPPLLMSTHAPLGAGNRQLTPGLS